MAFSAPVGASPGPEARRHQGRRRPLKEKEGQRVIALVGMVIERQFLLAMGGIIGVIKVEYDGRGGLCVAGNVLVHQGRSETRDVLAVHTVFEP